MIKIDHTTISKNPKLGWYEVGGKVFWDKASALFEATKLNLTHKDLKWNFNDEIFSKANWTVEPPGSIRDYYHMRARQIREKYDYIILNFSGGSDSTTALYSFIQQGLHVDEVVVRHASSATKKYELSKLNLNAGNEFAEFEYAAKPILKWLEKVSPRTKITIHDFSKDIIDPTINWDENFIHWTGDYVAPTCIVRYTHSSNIEHLRKFDQGKKIGLIFGTDKPRVVFQNEDVNFVFVDRPVHSAFPSSVNNGYNNTEVELFYWSTDLPELMIKQCHIIKRWFEMPENQRLSYMLNFWWQISSANRTTYEACVKALIYPDYDLRTWQVNKTLVNALTSEWDFWIKDYKDTTGYKTFMRGVDHLYKNISPNFLQIAEAYRTPDAKIDPMNWEYRACLSKMYYIGKFKKLES
jgi:hypothetical protein